MYNLKVYGTKCRLRMHIWATHGMQQALIANKTLWDDNKVNMLTYIYPAKQLVTEWSYAITKLTDCFTFGMVFYLSISNNREE